MSTNYETLGRERFEKMLDLLGFEASVNTSVKADDTVQLKIETEDPGRIIGRNGRTLRAMQFLINTMFQRESESAPRVVIDVDGYREQRAAARKEAREKGRGGNRRGRPGREERAPKDAEAVAEEVPMAAPTVDTPQEQGDREDRHEGEREAGRDERRRGGGRRGGRNPRRSRDGGRAGGGRDDGGRAREERESGPVPEFDDRPVRPGREEDDRDRLRRRAIEAVKEVRRWGDSVLLPPMNAWERKVLHEALAEFSDVKTDSEASGQGDKKRVRVSLTS